MLTVLFFRPELFNELIYENINVDAIHADCTTQQVGFAFMGHGVDWFGACILCAFAASLTVALSSPQRDEAVKHFREGDIWVLICTDLMARGVDFKVGRVRKHVTTLFPSRVKTHGHRHLFPCFTGREHGHQLRLSAQRHGVHSPRWPYGSRWQKGPRHLLFHKL